MKIFARKTSFLYSTTILKKKISRDSCQQIEEINDRLNSFSNTLGLNEQYVESIRSQVKSNVISIEDMEKNAKYLLSRGFDKAYIAKYSRWLRLSPTSLQSKIQICEESGCIKECMHSIIKKFRIFISCPIPILKVDNIIPEHINVFNRLREEIGLSKRSSQSIPSESTWTLYQLYRHTFESYFRENHFLEKQDTMPKWKLMTSPMLSIQTFKQNMSLMSEILGCDVPREKKYCTLLLYESLLEKSDFLKKTDWLETFINYPELLSLPIGNCCRLLEICKEYEVDLSVISKHISVFNSSDVIDSLLNCLRSPRFRTFRHHPKFMIMLQRYDSVQERFRILDEHQLKCSSPTLLLCSDSIFQNYLRNDIDKTEGQDTYVIVSRTLNIPFKKVRKELGKNKFALYVPIMRVNENIVYLKDTGYSNEEISNCMQIILYPKSTIEAKLNHVLSNHQIFWKNNKVSIEKHHHLPLTLYFIEKDNECVFDVAEDAFI